MIRHVLLAVVAILVSGCMSLKQERVLGGERHDHFGYYDRLGFGLLSVGAPNLPKAVRLVDEASFAISPNGDRFAIKSEPHAFDIEQGYPYVRDRIYLVSAGGECVKVRDDGIWKFVFSLDTATGRQSRTFEAKVWTFIYKPLIHGPPN
jgi:hypothetical protein